MHGQKAHGSRQDPLRVVHEVVPFVRAPVDPRRTVQVDPNDASDDRDLPSFGSHHHRVVPVFASDGAHRHRTAGMYYR